MRVNGGIVEKYGRGRGREGRRGGMQGEREGGGDGGGDGRREGGRRLSGCPLTYRSELLEKCLK